MKILIDDANIEKIKELYDFYPIDGVTTNPSILAKTGRAPYDVLKEIREFIGAEAELHAQVISRNADTMVEEGREIVKVLGKETYIKIPAVPEGIKAMKMLSKEGYRVTATAIYTPMQAFWAAKAGADYAAPYVNRIDNLGADGIHTTKVIQDIFKNNGFKTKILAASFKNSHQVQALCQYGVGAATLAPDVIHNLLKNASVTSAVEVFISDFEKLTGDGVTMSTSGE